MTRMVHYEPTTHIVQVRDEDDTEKKIYNLTEDKVLPLGSGKLVHWEALKPGDVVLALYPLTTTFYPGEVVSLNSSTERLCIRFDGDEIDDDTGLLVVKEVPTYFVADKLV